MTAPRRSPPAIPGELEAEEARVAGHSAAFRKELGTADLVLTQVLFIVGLPWVGVAAKQGPSHLVLWLGAMALFYLPSAAVITWLARLMPLEGGLYQWARIGFNDATGFLVAWNLWLFAILNTSEIGLQVTQYLAYIVGPAHAALTQRADFIALTSIVVVGALVAVTIVGLGVGKWVHKAGGALLIVTFAAVIALPPVNRLHGSLASYHPLATTLPVLSLATMNLFGKMGFGAFGGFEYVAIHAGECRDPVRTIRRSVLIAAPIVAAMFILGTSSVLALIPVDRIDLIAPIPQVLSDGFGRLGVAASVVPMTLMVFLGIRVAQSSVTFSGNTRLPMVAGWDRLLPGWFTRLSVRHRTPVHSILFVGAATLALGLAGLLGVGKQEAFQLLWNASGVFYAITYVAMFAIPLIGLRSTSHRAPTWIRVAAASGLAMTLLYIAVSVVPIINVPSPLTFGLKIGGLILGANLLGAVLFAAYGRRHEVR